MATPFMFKKANLPNRTNLPAWLNRAFDKIEKLKTISNKAQQGYRDISDAIGREVDKKGDVANLTARMKAEEAAIKETEAKIGELRLAVESDADELRQALVDRPDLTSNLAPTIDSESQDLLRIFLRVFDDLENLRQISPEHKAELFNEEYAVAKRQIADLKKKNSDLKQTNLQVPADDGSMVDRSKLDEMCIKLDAAEQRALDMKAELTRVEDARKSEARDHAVALASAKGTAERAEKKLAASKKKHQETNEAILGLHAVEILSKNERLQETINERDNHVRTIGSLKSRLQQLDDNQSQLGHARDHAQQEAEELEEKCRDLQVQNSKCLEEIEQSKQGVAYWENQYDISETRIAQLKGLLDASAHSLREANSAQEASRAECEQAVKERNNAKEDRAASLTVVNNLRTELQLEKQSKSVMEMQANEKIATLGGLAKRYRDERNAAENRMTNYHEMVKVYVEQLEADVANLVSQEKRDRASAISQSDSAMERQNQNHANSIGQLKADHAATMHQLKEDHANAVHELNETHATAITKLKQDYHNDQEQLKSECKNAIEGIEAHQDELRDRFLASQQERLNGFYEKLQTLSEQASRLITKNNGQEQTIAELEGECATRHQAQETLKQRIHELEDDVAEKTLAAELLRDQIRTAETNSAQSIAQVTQKLRETEDSMADIDGRDVFHIMDLEKGVVDLTAKVAERESQITALQQSKNNLESEVTDLNQSKNSLESEVTALNQSKNELELEMTALNQSKKNLELERAALKSKIKTNDEANKAHIDALSDEIQKLTVTEQNSAQSNKRLQELNESNCQTITQMREKFVKYLAMDTKPPQKIERAWTSMLDSLLSSSLIQPASGAPLPPFWTTQHPWLSEANHIVSIPPSEVDVMHVLTRLYGLISTGDMEELEQIALVYGLIELLAELFKEGSRSPIFDNVLRLILTTVINTLPNIWSEVAKLFCIGIWQLGIFIQERWGMRLTEVDQLQEAISNSSVYRKLWQPTVNGDITAIKKLCSDEGILQGHLGLLQMAPFILVIDTEALSLRLIDCTRITFSDHARVSLKAPQGYDDIVVDINDQEQFTWWLTAPSRTT